MPSEARACAHTVLRRVFEQDAYADRAFRSAATKLSPRDRQLARRLAYGAVQRKGTIDHFLSRLTRRPTERLDGAVLAALRAGAYELLWMHGAPDHAVVDDSVELAKRARSHGSGLVNAVLRRIAGERESLLGELEDSTPAAAAIAHSHPVWLAEMWWRQLGAEQARALMAAGNEPAETAVRANTLIASVDEIAARLAGEIAQAHPPRSERGAGRLEDDLEADLEGGGVERAAAGVRRDRDTDLLGVELPEAIVIDGPFDLATSPLWREGAVIAQSRAAMLVSRVLRPRSGERILDLCAAPGGKSTHIAALMEGEGAVLAVEADAARARELGETVTRAHADIVAVERGDATRPRQAGERFDRVLLDAPCSGLGTLQSHPDLRWRMTPKRIEALAELQCKMLLAASEAVSADGTLLYSTCTISSAENERQIDDFLSTHPEFTVDPPAGAAPMSGDGRFLLTLPDRDRTAGFFIARMRRQ